MTARAEVRETVLSLVAGEPYDSGDWLERENPVRPSEVVGRVSIVSSDGVDAAVVAADQAFVGWSALSVEDRIDQVLRACDAVAAEDEQLATLLSLEMGKVPAGTLGEIRFANTFARYCAGIVADLIKPRRTVDASGRLEVVHEPFGVVAAVTPWNAPVILSYLKVIPALLTGNTVVLKPSPLAPLAITRLLSILGSNLPAGVLSVVNGDGPVGAALTGHPLVRKVAFTGGSTVARHIMRATAENLVPSVMELGGNDAAVFLADAELSEAQMELAILGSFLSSGQVCMAAKRLYVHSSRIEEFTDAYVAVAKDLLVTGDPLEPGVTIGPLINRAAVARVEELTAAAVGRGATAHVLGTVQSESVVAEGYFALPTLLTGVRDDDRVVAEEQFGPVVPLLSFDDVDEVVERVNNDPLGLGSSVWSADVDRAFAIGRRLKTGYTFINSHNRYGMSMKAPFGGMKGSGFGREYGPDGVLEYVQAHSLFAPAATEDAQGYPGQSS